MIQQYSIADTFGIAAPTTMTVEGFMPEKTRMCLSKSRISFARIIYAMSSLFWVFPMAMVCI